MRKLELIAALLYLCLVYLITSCGQVSPDHNSPYSTEPEVSDIEASIERGRYLITLMDCNSCHTPKIMTEQGPVPDPARMLSGHPGDQPFIGFEKEDAPKGNWLLFNSDLTTAIGPWGVSFSANLTPDPSGLGNWTYEQFKMAITAGKHKGMENGRSLLPPMPWQSYAELKEEDIRAIFDYLRIIKPIENIVPPPIPPADLTMN